MGNYLRFIYSIYNNLIVKKLNTGDYAAYSKRDIQNLMTSSGFRIKDAQDTTKFIYTIVGVK